MKVGLISDTHIPEAGKELPSQVRQVFEACDLILHAGDLHVLSVLDWLEEIAPVVAARGNGDIWLPPDPRLKQTQAVTAEGWRIGLSHGLALPEILSWRALEKIMDRDFNGLVDVIVFGDTHVETIETYKGILLINPGSPTLPHNLMPQPGTVGLLDVTTGKVEAQIISLGFPLVSAMRLVYTTATHIGR
jgi:hypothetical protein